MQHGGGLGSWTMVAGEHPFYQTYTFVSWKGTLKGTNRDLNRDDGRRRAARNPNSKGPVSRGGGAEHSLVVCLIVPPQSLVVSQKT